MSDKQYKELFPTNEYDHAKAEIYGEAATELLSLKKREKYLEDLLKQNKPLAKFMWTTLDGRTAPLHALDQSHLKNILKHIVAHGGAISPQIRAEAMERGLEIPEDNNSDLIQLMSGRDVDGEIVDWDE